MRDPRLSLLVGAVILALCSGAIAGDASPKAAFDRAYEWIKSEQMIGHYIVSDKDHPKHRVTSTLVKAPEQFGIAYALVEPVVGHPAYLSEDKQTLYLLDDGALSPTSAGAPLSVQPIYYFTGVEDGAAIVRLAFLYDNTDTAYALMLMNEATGDDLYLAEAGRILRQAFARVGEDGRYLRQFADEAPTYTGMAQAILMHDLDRYASLSHEQWASDAVAFMAKGFAHTTEGTWNHWTNSVMGMLIADRFGEAEPKQLAGWKETFDVFMSQIRKQNGVIPYIMKESDKRWPLHKATYQTYDLQLLLQLAQMDDYGLKSCSHFPEMFTEATKLNGQKYGGRNTLSAVLGSKLCGADVDEYLESRRQFLAHAKAPASINEAIGQMFTAAALMALEPT